MSNERKMHFVRQWRKTNIEESNEEERQRYSATPWNERLIKYLRKTGLIEKDTDASDT